MEKVNSRKLRIMFVVGHAVAIVRLVSGSFELAVDLEELVKGVGNANLSADIYDLGKITLDEVKSVALEAGFKIKDNCLYDKVKVGQSEIRMAS